MKNKILTILTLLSFNLSAQLETKSVVITDTIYAKQNELIK